MEVRLFLKWPIRKKIDELSSIFFRKIRLFFESSSIFEFQKIDDFKKFPNLEAKVIEKNVKFQKIPKLRWQIRSKKSVNSGAGRLKKKIDEPFLYFQRK